MNSQENLIKKPTKNNMDYKIIEFKSITEKTWNNKIDNMEAWYMVILRGNGLPLHNGSQRFTLVDTSYADNLKFIKN